VVFSPSSSSSGLWVVWEGVEAKPNRFPSDCGQAAGLSTERHYPQPPPAGRIGLTGRRWWGYGNRAGQDNFLDHDGVAVAAASSGLVLPCPARAVPIQKLGGARQRSPESAHTDGGASRMDPGGW
jgi:hypothetical protein